MCKQAGVTQEQVDKFDVEFDLKNQDKPDLGAGDDPEAPYYRQHIIATAIEVIFGNALGVDWEAYMKHLGTVYPGPSKSKK
jgi:hypothetical protein